MHNLQDESLSENTFLGDTRSQVLQNLDQAIFNIDENQIQSDTDELIYRLIVNWDDLEIENFNHCMEVFSRITETRHEKLSLLTYIAYCQTNQLHAQRHPETCLMPPSDLLSNEISMHFEA